MNAISIFQAMSSLSGIAMISFGSLWLKQYIKRNFCFS